MGTNIGTSLTSTVIALYHIKQNNEYRLGFTAAIMTDLFNWMTVLVLLPLEMVTGFLAGLSELLVDLILTDHQTSSNHLSSLIICHVHYVCHVRSVRHVWRSG